MPAPAEPSRPSNRAAYAARSLLDLCDPLFLLLCRLNRSTRLTNHPPLHADQVRAEILTALNSMQDAAETSHLDDSFRKIREPLRCFIDDLILSSRLPFAQNWQRLAHDAGGFSGDAKFFDLLDITLDEVDPAAEDRLAVFFVCLGLGFEGKYRGDRAQIDAYLARITARIGDRLDLDEKAKICPDAYHFTDRRPLAEPVAAKLFSIGIVAAILIAIAFAISGTIYFLRTNSLKRDLNAFHELIHANEPARQPGGAK